MYSMVTLPEDIQVRMTQIGRRMSETYKKYANSNMTSAMRRCFNWGDGSFEKTWDDPNDVLIFEFDNQGYCDDLIGRDKELPDAITRLDGDAFQEKAMDYVHKKLAFAAYKKKFDDMAKKVNPKFAVHGAGDEQYQMWLHFGG